jgi:hypothetical protein
MRRILVNQARKQSIRHGGDRQRIPELPHVADHQQKVEQTLAVDEWIDKLTADHPRQAEVAKMRLFLELAFSEIAQVLGISVDSAEKDWKFARAWLRREWSGAVAQRQATHAGERTGVVGAEFGFMQLAMAPNRFATQPSDITNSPTIISFPPFAIG